MRKHGRSWLAIGTALLALYATEATGAAASEDASAPLDAPFVCAQVVLAIDGSASTREGAFHRQIESLRAAFGSESLYRAIQDCLPGSVAFAAITWSGPDAQDLCLDWSLVTNGDEGEHLARHLERCRYFGGSTDIGRAVDYGLRVLERSPFASYYRIVFVLTNGRTDRSADARLAAARAHAAAAAVTVTAYALLRPEPRPGHLYVASALPLERYVAERVTVGPRAFTAYARPGGDCDALLRALVEMLRQEAS
jgi:hypothetical protein